MVYALIGLRKSCSERKKSHWLIYLGVPELSSKWTGTYVRRIAVHLLRVQLISLCSLTAETVLACHTNLQLRQEEGSPVSADEQLLTPATAAVELIT